jgi:hypothetical protein
MLTSESCWLLFKGKKYYGFSAYTNMQNYESTSIPSLSRKNPARTSIFPIRCIPVATQGHLTGIYIKKKDRIVNRAARQIEWAPVRRTSLPGKSDFAHMPQCGPRWPEPRRGLAGAACTTRAHAQGQGSTTPITRVTGSREAGTVSPTVPRHTHTPPRSSRAHG